MSSFRIYNNNNNNNNNNIVIYKVQKVSSNAESVAPAVARWAALVGYAKRTVFTHMYKKVHTVQQPDRR